jgi:hypothetical protein
MSQEPTRTANVFCTALNLNECKDINVLLHSDP